MTPEEKQQFEDLKNEVKLLRNAENVNTNELVINTLVSRATSSGVDLLERSITIPGGLAASQIDVLDYPETFIEIKYKGSLYRLPAYLATRFV